MKYGVFNDDGLLEGPFDTVNAAERAAPAWRSAEDYVIVEEICDSHPNQQADECDECRKAKKGSEGVYS